ncbi:MAG: lytic transglycosylase domain-containing protein [Saprospiraceae bacterium]|nr:lytic transglycosylase domain-containing protein [Saprospiraceae bacterium]
MNMLNVSGYLALSVWAILCPVSASADSETMSRIAQLETPFSTKGCEAGTIRKINDYVRPMKPGARRLLRRMDHFFPAIEQHLEHKRLPDFLKYIPVAESKLSTRVVSPHGAAGLWQLMPATARNYGLEVSSRKDERLDPERATEAALNFLQDLYYEFDDWALALAAYNCGSGKVKKAIRRSNSRNYQAIKLLLPKQTRHYLPSLIAAAYLDSYYRKNKQCIKDGRTEVMHQEPGQIFSNFPEFFFKKQPALVFKPLEEHRFPLLPPTFWSTPALVQMRSGQRTIQSGDAACKQV